MTEENYNQQLCQFLTEATTPFHAVAAMRARLESAGFSALDESDTWSLKPGGKYYVVRNGSAIVAFVNGSKTAPVDGMRMVGAHTDSPCLMVKPSPEINRKGYEQLGVQVYGGALLNPWFDRDLSLAGRVSFVDADGDLHQALVDFREPIACIPSLAIHLDRDANNSRKINAQTDIVPLLSLAVEGDDLDFRALLRQRLHEEHPGLDIQRVLDFELSFYDTQPPSLVGLKQEFLASARLDNLLSCFAGLQSLLDASGEHSALLVCTDHEEVGSTSTSGANGPFLSSVLERLAPERDDHARLCARSLMISADNAHGIHPNYPDRHDANHGPLLNAGPVIKVNANQRYATSSETSGLFRLLAERSNVSVQTFVVRSDMACGSTIGPITAGVTGIRTLDVGVPTFAMHSIRELAGSEDAASLSRVLQTFFDFEGPLVAS